MRHFFIFLVFVVVLAVNFYPIVFQNKTLAPDAQSTHVFDGGGPYWQIEPFVYLNHYYLFNRILPLWNPYNGAGLPFSAIVNAGCFSPLNLPAILYPSQFTMDISALIRLLLAGLMMYYFLRLWEISSLSSFLGSILYMLSTHNIWCIMQFHIHTVSVTPAILFFLERLIRHNKKSDLFLSIVFISLAILGGNPEEIILVMILSSGYYSYRVIFQKQEFSAKIILLLKGVFIFLIAFGLTAFFIIPALEFYLNSEVAPRVLDSDFSKYCSNFPYRWVFVLNAIMSFLVLISLVFGSRLSSRKAVPFFLLYIIVFLCLLFNIPFFDWLGKFQPFSHIWWGKYRATLYLATGFLTAIGLDIIKNRNVLGRIVYCPIFCLILICIFFQTPRLYSERLNKPYEFPGQRYLKDILKEGEFRVLPIGIRHVLEPNRNCIYRIPVMGYSGALHEKRYYEFINSVFNGRPESAVFNDGRFLDMLGVKYLYSNRGVLLFGDTDKLLFEKIRFNASRDIQPRFLSVDGKVKKGYVLCEGEEAVLEVKIADDRVLKFSISPDPFYTESGYPEGITFFIDMYSEDGIIRLFEKHLGQEGARWNDCVIDISRYKGKTIKLVFKNQAERPGVWANIMLTDNESAMVDIENSKWEMVFCDDVNADVVYRNREPVKRAYIVHRAEKVKDVLKRLLDPEFDPKSKILTEKELPEDFYNCKGAPAEDNSNVELTKYKPNRVVLRANMENDGFLVFGDAYYPGWRVFVDNKEKEIILANCLFRAVYLEKGRHDIQFRYTPLTFKLGSVISISALFLLIVTVKMSKK